MFTNWIYLNFYVALMQQIISANYLVTDHNRVLAGHSFKELYTTNWLNCIQACYDEPKCISYNYQRSGAENGVCELNDSGVENLCDRDEVLIYSSGFVFQQIRKIKVSIYWLHVHFNCGKVGRLYYDEATKNFREGKLQ